jgi:hypothetical protein
MALRQWVREQLIKMGLLYCDDKGIPSFADRHNDRIAVEFAKRLGVPAGKDLAAQTKGKEFERFLKMLMERTVESAYPTYRVAIERPIHEFQQYMHYSADSWQGETTPDVELFDPGLADNLLAVVSAKWTTRSDRDKNGLIEATVVKSECHGLVPRFFQVTAEPLPSRIASSAKAPGSEYLDCTYHIALHELSQAVTDVGTSFQQRRLQELVAEQRLKDITELPHDLLASLER